MSICNDICSSDILKNTINSDVTSVTKVDLNIDNINRSDVVYVNFPRFRSNMSFIQSDASDLFTALDAARVSDVIIFATKFSQDDYSLMMNEVNM